MDSQLFTPVIALLGTVAVGALGFYQWRRQYSNPNRTANAAARREAYEGLWQCLEKINLDLRRREFATQPITEQLQGINTYFISHSLYFDDDDQNLVNSYVEAMNDLQEKVRNSDNPQHRESFRLTAKFSLNDIDEVGKAMRRVEALRTRIKSKAQKVAASL